MPTGEPTNFTVGPLNSTAVHISWSPPAPEKQNGILISYIVNFTTVHSGSIVIFTVHSLEVEVGHLQPYSVYAVAVASQNSVGVGPYTRTALVQTLEDGTYVVLSTILPYFHFLNSHIRSSRSSTECTS